MASFRLVVLVLFFVMPTASLVHFLIRFLGLEIISNVNGSTLRGRAIFSFPPAWYNGQQWRWVSDNPAIRPSAFPGAQPICYVALVALSVVLLLSFIILIFRLSAPSGSSVLSRIARWIKRELLSLVARVALRFAGPKTLLRVGVVLSAELDTDDSVRARFKLARATAYLGDPLKAIELDRPGAAYGYLLLGRLREAIDLLEEKRHGDSSALIHWQSLNRIEDHCQKQNDYRTALDEALRSYHKQILGDLALTVFGEHPDREWPPALADFSAYFAAPTKLISGWVTVRDHNLLREVTSERLRELRKFTAPVQELKRLDEIALDLAALLQCSR